MTSEEIKKAREIIEAATEGPWEAHTDCVGHEVEVRTVALPFGARQTWVAKYVIDSVGPDAQFISAARTGWPAALNEIERLRTENLAYSVRAENDARRIEAWKAAAEVRKGHGTRCAVNMVSTFEGDPTPTCYCGWGRQKELLEAARALEENE